MLMLHQAAGCPGGWFVKEKMMPSHMLAEAIAIKIGVHPGVFFLVVVNPDPTHFIMFARHLPGF
ncbi:hypothetical protein [Rhodoferax fermentans]|uniref:hypothetical protein n=1 Tax=Rhodoferax fermentans TaxID=28066 RepID=UPI0011798CC4|nr:hypothetical protein [Rhodoferax fermentans]